MTSDTLAVRIACRRRLIAALADCDVPDAEEVIYAYLSTVRAGAPRMAFDDVEAEAKDWAASATAPELWFYFVACGLRLRDEDLGQRGMIQLARRVAEQLPEGVRRQLAEDLLASIAQQDTPPR